MSSSEVADNLERQDEELSVLDSIYANEIVTHTTDSNHMRKLELQITPDAKLRISLTARYPSHEGPGAGGPEPVGGGTGGSAARIRASLQGECG